MARQAGQKVGQYGRGNLTEIRPGVWKLRERIGGKQLSVVIGSNAEPLTRKQALRRQAGASSELRQRWASGGARQDPTGDVRTFGDVLDEWLKRGRTKRGTPWQPKTRHENEREVGHRIRPTLGAYPLEDITPALLEGLYDEWSARGGPGGRPLHDRTVNRVSKQIRTALEFAVRRGYIPTNPATRAVAPASTGTKAIPATKAQVADLRAAAPGVGLDMEKVVILAAVTGARPGEIAALRWSDIDLPDRAKTGTVHIRTAATAPNGSAPQLKNTKTGAVRRVPVTGANLEALRLALGKRPTDSDAFVIDGGDTPVRPAVLSDRFTVLRKAAKIRPGLTLYSLRHAWATNLLSAGIPVHTVARLGGWKTPALVLSTYGHHVPDDEGRAALVAMI